MKLRCLAECTREHRRCLNLPNDVVTAIAVQSSATWGLDRSGWNYWYEHTVKYDATGSNVDVYILEHRCLY
jgi:hypothetical protein